MADRPILFSGPMVRALLDGRKTQTRRVVKPQPLVSPEGYWSWSPHRAQGLYHGQGGSVQDMRETLPAYSPYGVPGDRLWVRETHAIVPTSAYRMSDGVQQTVNPADQYEAAVYREGWERSKPRKWRPSIHMPRWASRLTLQITDVRIERLNDCSKADARAEGLQWIAPGKWAVDHSLPIVGDDPRHVYRDLWDHINGSGAWAANPWVWVVAFEREEAAHG